MNDDRDDTRPIPPHLDPRRGPRGVGRPPGPRDAAIPEPAHDPGAPPEGRRAGSSRAPRELPADGGSREASGFGSALGLTALGAVLPGTAFLAAGRRRLGTATLAVFLVLVAGGIYLATAGRSTAAQHLVDRDSLRWLIVGLVVLAVMWVLVIIAGYRMLAPDRTTRGQHLIGALVVVLLTLGIALPAMKVVDIAAANRDLIGEVFTGGQSATVEEDPKPFADRERVNVLLLGGDAGPGREGLRTDTIIVASIDTDTGETVLFSLPRNLQNLPFPPGTRLAEIYPDGFEGRSESEGLLNAVYGNGPTLHPDALERPSDHPGADWLKIGVGEALGLNIDYFVLVNLEGFPKLIDALGGITVNVNEYVPINGEPSKRIPPDDHIEPGPDQHMNGERALHFARGRYGTSDYDRMGRQRCTIAAIIDAAQPGTVLRKYNELAAATKGLVETDIPPTVLDDFVALGFQVKEAAVRSVVFDPELIDPSDPDYDQIRQLVQQEIAPPPPAPSPPGNGSPAEQAPDDAAPAEGDPAAPSPPGPVTDVEDACAFDPARAQQAIEEGEPPTRAG